LCCSTNFKSSRYMSSIKPSRQHEKKLLAALQEGIWPFWSILSCLYPGFEIKKSIMKTHD
jgi:hypothetical protein